MQDGLWPCEHYTTLTLPAALAYCDKVNHHIPSIAMGANRYAPFHCECDAWHCEAADNEGRWSPRVPYTVAA